MNREFCGPYFISRIFIHSTVLFHAAGQFLCIALASLVCLTSANSLDRFCQGVTNGQFVASPRSCQHWLFCQNNGATEGVCPGMFYFDGPMQMCRYPDFVNCQIDSVEVTCPIDDLVLKPHPTNCDQYVACINGFPRVINCAPGLNWDATRQLCDLPDNTDCVVS